MKIGEILRTEREKRGLSLAEVEEATKIRARYLQALEDERFNDIPGEAYCLGFLRNYARFLDIDPEPLIYDMRSQSAHIDEQVPSPSVFELSTPRRFSGGKVVFGLAVLVALVFLVYSLLFNTEEKVPSPTDNTPSQREDVNQKEPTEKPSQRETIILQLTGKERCWTQVTVDGNVEFSGTLYPGDLKDFEASERIEVRLGNAGGVEITYNGKKMPPLGRAGEVVEKEYTKSS